VGTNHLIRSLAFTTDNQRLVVGCDKGVVKVFDDDCPDRLPTHVLEAKVYETLVKISGNGTRLLVSGCPGAISLFDLKEGKYLDTFPMQVSSFGLSPDGTRMWADDSVYDLTGTNEPKRVRQFEGSEVLQVSDKQISTANDGKISFWNAADGKLQREFDTGLTNLHASADGRWLVSVDQVVRVLDLATGKQFAMLDLKEACHDALVSFDGKYLVTMTGKYTVRVWDIATGKVIATLAMTEYYWPIAMSPAGTVAYTKDGHRVEFWNADAVR
jgi:WD40 repeat protein